MHNLFKKKNNEDVKQQVADGLAYVTQFNLIGDDKGQYIANDKEG